MTAPHVPAVVEAEAALLGSVFLRGREALAEALETLTESEFYHPRHAAVFRAMRIVDERGDPVDPVTVDAQLRRTGEAELVGGIEGLARLDRHATPQHVRVHARAIRDYAVARRLHVWHREQAERWRRGPGDELAADVAGEQTALAELALAAAGNDDAIETLGTALARGVAEVEARVEAGETGHGAGARFGFRALDRAFGAMLPGEYWIIGARTGNGKSALGWAIARNNVAAPIPGKRGQWYVNPHASPVLFLSNEMPTSAIALRALSESARINGSAFRRPDRAWWAAHADTVGAAFRGLERAPVYLAHRPRYTVEQAVADLRLWARRMASEGRRPGLVVIDYLQRFQIRDRVVRRATRTEQIAFASALLHDAAKECGVPLLVLMQLNRATEDRGDGQPKVSDLRESGAPEQDADGIGLLWRPERYHPQASERKARLLALESKIADPGSALTDAERTEYAEIYRASLLALLKFPKARGADPDWTWPLEFLPQFTRFLDQIDNEHD